jgi:phosphoserine phosphatase RsbU/P
MKILTIDDDPIAHTVLESTLRALGHEPIAADEGLVALRVLEKLPVRVVVSDWVMPGMDGLELCRRVRARTKRDYVYFILLTNLTATRENRESALAAGVDDFLTKPVNADEIWMRLRVAERILQFTKKVEQLESFLPICSYCKKVRDDQNYWQQIETYVSSRTSTQFSHGVCPDCYHDVVMPQLEKLGIDVEDLPPPEGQ